MSNKRLVGRLFLIAILSVLLIISLLWWSFVNMFNGPYQGGVLGVVQLASFLIVFTGSCWLVIVKTKKAHHE